LLAASPHLLVDAVPGVWIEIPDTLIRDVLPKRSFEQPIHRIVGPRAIVGAWSGGAYDTKRNRLMIFGGGHADYCGNEWLAFDLDDLRWHLLSGPSNLAGYDDKSGKTPDGNPASRHTYNGLAYIPETDEFLVHGGALCNGAGSADNRWWVGDPENGKWTFQGGKATWLLGYSLAYDSATGKVFESRRGPLYAYSPESDKWEKLTKTYGDIGLSSMTADIDPERRKFLLIGQGKAFVYDLVTKERTSFPLDKSIALASAKAPGFAYVSSIDRFVAWAGGNELYLINPETWAISTVKTLGIAPASATHGTYGRFRYSEKYNGFVLVAGVERNVFFLKMPDIQAADTEHTVAGQQKGKPSSVLANTSSRQVKAPGQVNDKWPVSFGKVWCPDNQNSGSGFHRVESYFSLPNDPLGDGENNCYMEAFDTSVFSTDGQALRSCENLDYSKFPGHTCKKISTQKDFKNLAFHKKVVAIIPDDLIIQRTFEPYIALNQESLVVIGAYENDSNRPVLIKDGSPAPSTYFNWGSKADGSSLTLINLRLHSSGLCVQLNSRGASMSVTAMSVTAKCRARFIIAGPEKRSTTHKVDNRIYFKGVMARSKNSHTVYLDRTYLNWVEDSLIMGPWLPGKHAAKYTAKNVVVRNSLHTNQGVHGGRVDDPEYYEAKRTHMGKGGLAPISLASCNRAVIDGVTIVNHAVWGNSNPQSIQWQFRDAIGAGCDMPRMYAGSNPQQAYKGPVWFEGRLEQQSPGWSDGFWRNPKMLDSYVVNSQIVQTYDDRSRRVRHYSLMSDGTYPSVRDDGLSARYAAKEIPPAWKERQRIHVSGNCFDNGIQPRFMFKNHSPRGMSIDGKHKYDRTNKFVTYGTNLCGNKEAAVPSVKASVARYLHSLPQPPWAGW
jgi:hypothetical protein